MKDNFFSPIAREYALFRPRYPEALYSYLASIAPGRSMVWDCATGSGQAAQGLAGHFDHVEATDISKELLAQAEPHERITYRVANALESGLPGRSVDLVTIANAMHWFHGKPFEAEVRRVLKPEGIVAAWSFAYSYITPEVDLVTRKVHNEIVGPFWIGPNRIVENGYGDLEFDFKEIAPPGFEMISGFDLHQVEGYMRTWSASTKYLRHHGVDPVGLVHEELLHAVGDLSLVRPVHWQLALRVGRV